LSIRQHADLSDVETNAANQKLKQTWRCEDLLLTYATLYLHLLHIQDVSTEQN